MFHSRFSKKVIIEIKKWLRFFYVYQARQKTLAFSNESHPLFKSLIEALQETFENKLSPEEKDLIQKIESLRLDLCASKDKIDITDYGAGLYDGDRTEEEMQQGVVVPNQTVGDICLSASKPYFWTLLLYKYIRKIKPSVCIEMGTCLGISASYQALALKLNQKGKIISMEGSAPSAAIAKQNFQILNLECADVVVGKFSDTLDDVLAHNKPIDYIFIDGHHDKDATIMYFNQVLPFLSDKAVLLFDDISINKSMRSAWETIAQDKRVMISVDLRTLGICIIDDTITHKRNIRIPLM